MTTALSPEALDQIFRTARTYNDWTETPVDEGKVHELYDLLKWGPTAANTCPARFVWVRSPEGKSQLSSLARGPNKPKILAAPLIVIIGNDLDFGESMPKLVPSERAAQIQQMLQEPGLVESMAMRNGSLQGAYLIVAARMLGLDCGPMSGFDNAGVDAAFFAGTHVQSNFICCVGYGQTEAVHQRNPRLTFDEAGRFA